MRRAEPGVVAGCVLLLLIGAWAAVEALGFGLWRGGSPGEGLYPFAVAAGLLVLAGLATVSAFASSGRIEPAPVPAVDAAAGEGPADWRKAGLYVAGLVAFAVLLEPLGYKLVTGAVLVLVLRLAEGLGWRMTLAVTAATLAATHLLFERLLALQLPRGALF